ncbi:MAG TPA: EAL domain-containing protein [Xanthobacteraceae bacterium]|nr:EAL domain-containing protein [Xanthobacteraceae bacterium]
MQELIGRYRLGEWWIAAVGLVVAAAIASLIGIAFLVAHRVDQDSVRRDRALAKNGLESVASRARHDLATLAQWDEAVQRVLKNDASWIHHYFGERLRESAGHDLFFVLYPNGAPVYASIEGIDVYNALYDWVRPAADPIVAEVKNAYALRAAISPRADEDLDTAALLEPVSRAVFRRIDHKTALVVAAPVVPNHDTGLFGSHLPPVAVSVGFLEGELLRELGKDLSIDDLAVREGDQPADGKVGIALPLSAGDARSWLEWKPRKPGTAMLYRLMPVLAGLAAFIGFVGFLILHQARRSNQQLAESERRATELAFRDALTGLGNRAQLIETLSQSLASLQDGEHLALLFVDIDGFKDINDTLGHHVGDELLTVAAWRLASVKNCLTAARLGGDEFAVLLKLGKDVEFVPICRQVLESLRHPTPAGDHVLTVSASIGVAVAPEHADDPETLLRRADIALYRARTEGRGSLRMFDPGYEEALHKRGRTERELAKALAHDELRVLYQPLVSVDGERIVGVEALIRWEHPDQGLVPPMEFIPTAEHSGLIVRLDEWVLRRACETAARWPGIALAVNLSPSNFHHSDMVDRVTRILNETAFDPRRLEIEITENMLLHATPEVLGQLAEMRRIGIRVVLDDFGTGYSSLGYLRRFPVDKIKIDQTFVKNLGVTEEAAAIVECVARLGRALGLTVTAEGVETGEQHRFVRAAGCHQLQGFLFSPPVTEERISALVLPARAGRKHAVALHG